MGASLDAIAMIRSLFPGSEERIERSFWADASFRALCVDYRACHETLERLRRQDSPEMAHRQLEYAKLLEELAGEIRRWPEDRPLAHGTDPDPGHPHRPDSRGGSDPPSER
jgi:hypothetical protein